MHRTIILAILAALAASGALPATAQTPVTPQKPSADCLPGPGKYMNLTPEQFDQTLGKGWREIGDRPGCELAAADLIAFYRKNRVEAWEASLNWHEAQLRAASGQTAQALELFRKEVAYEASVHDDADRLYGEATIAFLEHDREALMAKRAELAALPKPDGFEIGIAKFKEKYPERPPPVWPTNLDTVDGLIHCFDKPYAEAYELACRVANSGTSAGQ
jgi:hypothetical protein